MTKLTCKEGCCEYESLLEGMLSNLIGTTINLYSFCGNDLNDNLVNEVGNIIVGTLNICYHNKFMSEENINHYIDQIVKVCEPKDKKRNLKQELIEQIKIEQEWSFDKRLKH